MYIARSLTLLYLRYKWHVDINKKSPTIQGADNSRKICRLIYSPQFRLNQIFRL